MSVLAKIRSHAGWLVAAIGLALFSFVIGDVFTSGKSFFGSNDKNVGEVAGKSIAIRDFEAKVQEATDRQKKKNPEAAMDDYTKDMIVDQVWNQTLNEIILNKEYEKLGITVSDDELYEMMLGPNPHPYVVRIFTDPKTGQIVDQFKDPRTGGLNMAKVLEFNQQMNPEQETFWVGLENDIRRSTIAQKYISLIKKSFYITSSQIKREYAEDNKVFKLKYVAKKYASLPDSSVSVTDEDLKNYYTVHQNEYKVEDATRKIEYVTFDAVTSAEDSAFIREDANKLVEDFKIIKSKEDSAFVVRESDNRSFDNTYYKKGSLSPDIDSIMFAAEKGTVIGPYIENNSYKISKLIDVKFVPDSVKARHILVKIVNGDTAKAKAKIDSLKKIITPKNFAEIAKKNSEDFGSAEKGGDLGWFPQGQMVPVFNDACFYGKKGDMPVVVSQFGVHLIEILDKGPEIKKVKVGTVERNITPSTKTLQSYYLKASQFSGKNNTPELFEKAAESLNKRIADNVKESDKSVAGLESPKELIRWMYSAKKGEISQAFEFGNKFVVALLTEVKDKGIPPMDQVKDEIEAGAIQDKKAAKLVDKYNSLLQGVSNINILSQKSGDPVQDIESFTFSKPSLPAIGRDGLFIGTVSTLNKGILSKPIKGKFGVYVVQVDDIKEASAAVDYSLVKNKIMNNLQVRAESDLFDALKATANVVDNRTKFY